jgi:hypothetical protein
MHAVHRLAAEKSIEHNFSSGLLAPVELPVKLGPRRRLFTGVPLVTFF